MDPTARAPAARKRAPRIASSYRAARRNAVLRPEPETEPATIWGPDFYFKKHRAQYLRLRLGPVRPNQRDRSRDAARVSA